MKILLLTDEMQIGGVSRHVVDIANGLNKNKIPVVVAATTGVMVKQLDSGIPFIDLHLMSDGLKKKSILGLFSSIRDLLFTVKKYHITHIHTHKRYSDFIGAIISRLTKIKHISTSHSQFPSKILASCFGRQIIAVSDAVKRNLEVVFKRDPTSITTIYNCLRNNTPVFNLSESDLREKHNLGKTDKLIVSIANFNTAKDYYTLIEAISGLRQKKRLGDVKIVFIGVGELEYNIRKMLSRYSLEKYVVIINDQNSGNDFLHSAYFVVLSSLQEGFPYVMLEAAAHSKPIIATNIGGTAEFIENKNTGLVVESKQVNQLTEALEYYLSNPLIVKQHGIRANKKLTEHFNFDLFLSKIIDVYARN